MPETPAGDGDCVRLLDGDIGAVENLHGCSNSVFLTCFERSGGCSYNLGPDRPDDHPLACLLSAPRCPACGCSLVFVPRAEYNGPDDEFRDLDTKGSPLVSTT